MFLFRGGETPCCMDAADANDDGKVDVDDSIFLLGYLYLGGSQPPFPGPKSCSLDLTEDDLTCTGYQAAGVCEVECPPEDPCRPFKRGDANADGCVDLCDGVFIMKYLFLNGAAPICDDAADANDDGEIGSINDAIYILSYVEAGGPAPPAPGPSVCGFDLTDDELDCNDYPQSVCSAGCPAEPACIHKWIRGDCNGDGEVSGTVSDAVFLLSFNFSGGRPPPCLAACDANGDRQTVGTVTDAVYLLSFNFMGGPPPPPPYPDCGYGVLSEALLGCENPPEACSGP